jgi:ribosomal protein S27AE
MTQNACPDCGAAMEEGFIPDMAHGNALQLAWQRGIPENKRFLGLKTRAVQLNESEWVKITARRCTKCGLLKLYARPTSE